MLLWVYCHCLPGVKALPCGEQEIGRPLPPSWGSHPPPPKKILQSQLVRRRLNDTGRESRIVVKLCYVLRGPKDHVLLKYAVLFQASMGRPCVLTAYQLLCCESFWSFWTMCCWSLLGCSKERLFAMHVVPLCC